MVWLVSFGGDSRYFCNEEWCFLLETEFFSILEWLPFFRSVRNSFEQLLCHAVKAAPLKPRLARLLNQVVCWVPRKSLELLMVGENFFFSPAYKRREFGC